ncbi:hypothetical protein ABMA28_004108 [Loxostege sticticalis]|uniref:Integrase catalytic domain-containing protein n=1 Tax=Loxostege sticticalis TaxID=481309 RepID=A0ABD0SU77_LOXSC
MTDIKELRALRGYSKSSLTRLTKLADDLGETSLQRLLTRRDRLKEVFAHMNRSTNIRNLISEIKQHLAALKNLNEPVESWNSVVVCIIMRKLDLVTSRAFQLDRNNKVLPTVKELLEYLEKRTLALETTDSSAHKPQWQAQRLVSHSVTAQQGQPSCLYCKSIAHKLFQCPNFKLASQNKRVEFAIANKICKICLTQHNRKCKYHFKCAECKREHNTLLHGIEPQENASPSVSLLSSTSGLNTQVLLPTAQVKLTAKHGKQILARALLDSGSQVSLVTNKIVGRLGLSPVRTNTHIVGITNIGQPVDKCINLELQSMVYPFKINVDCHIVKTITTQLPQTNIDLSSITFPANCKLADATFNVPGDVDLLLGADVFFQVLLPQPDVVSSPSSSQQCATPTTSAPQPSIIHTAFGVVVAGRSNTKTSNQVVSLFCNECNSNINDNLSAFWSTEKVPEIFPEQLPEHDYCERLFKDTTVLENNKFTVSMPTKVPLEQVNSELGESFPLALKRFYNLEKRLQKDPVLLTEYTKFIHQYISLKHGTIVDISSYDLSKDPVYFLPHHAMTVFDGSMRTTHKVSLNDLLLNGPVVQKDLFEVLLSFRLEKYYFICDIRMMFRCIELDPLQRPLQNILWRDSPDQDILCIQLNTVTYGLKPSSYLATRCLIELADRYQDQFPLASQILKNNTYVDDVLSNSDSQQTLTQMQDELVKLLSLGGFQLHKWASNCSNILSNVPKEAQHFGELDLQKHDMSVKTLGVTFHVEDDVFKTTSPEPYTSLSDSKREILSHISKFYDPMGLIGPILVQAKLIMQCLWASNTEWDSIPAPDIRTMWSNFVRDLHEMKQVSVPRCVKPHDTRIVQLIGFADASSKAHGCCLYLRTVDAHGKVHVELLCSKSRINPLRKQLTIPRLELNAAVLLSDLTSKVAHILSSKTRVHDIHLFSDSQIVLAWLQTDATKLQTYVANRVRAITEHAHKNCHWHYVNTEDNPSDCLSRGLQPHELECNNLWWHGPSFLFDRNYNFQSNCELPIELPELKSPKDNIVCVTVTSASDLFEELKKFSNINKMIRVLAYVLRFCNNIKPQAVRQSNFLSSCELNKAMRLIIKYEQGNLYQLEIKCLSDQTPIKGSLKPLSPFLDGDGIIRVGGRLNNAPISYAKQHPIILPKDSDITVLIIRNEHLRLLHAGQKLVLSSLRQRFWIVDGLRTVKKILHKCVTCFRMKAAATTQLMGSLPADRVTACRPFQKIGTDFAGPVAVKNSRIRKPVIGKGYIVLFVCFVTKAIHLELASDLTTDAFLACFKRFISRRNLPSDVYCDNGSTYKGARNKLDELYRLHASQSHQTTVQTFASEKGIDFHFIPSYSPIFGGLWESGVKSVKYHLKRIVGKALLTYVEDPPEDCSSGRG